MRMRDLTPVLVLVACICLQGCGKKALPAEAQAMLKREPQLPASQAPAPAPAAKNPNAFDWVNFPDTGGGPYSALAPASFDPDDHRNENTVEQRFPADTANLPEKNDDGSPPRIETDDQGKQWAVYTSHVPAKMAVSIGDVNLNPTKIGGRPYVFGSVLVTNLTPFKVVGLQLVYISGETKTTLLTESRAQGMIPDGIMPNTGRRVQVKSFAPNEDKTSAYMLLEAQIDGPPGLVTDRADLEEVLINPAGQVISPNNRPGP